MWAAAIGAAAAVGGVALAYKGQQDQKKANAAAQAQNQQSQDDQNKAAWGNYLLQRGIAPTTPVEPGVFPTAGNYQAVNTKLPIWMTIPQSQIDASKTTFINPQSATTAGSAGMPATSTGNASVPIANTWANKGIPSVTPIRNPLAAA